jgi:hypothetical protein
MRMAPSRSKCKTKEMNETTTASTEAHINFFRSINDEHRGKLGYFAKPLPRLDHSKMTPNVRYKKFKEETIEHLQELQRRSESKNVKKNLEIVCFLATSRCNIKGNQSIKLTKINDPAYEGQWFSHDKTRKELEERLEKGVRSRFFAFFDPPPVSNFDRVLL